jgi:hypothetical protein
MNINHKVMEKGLDNKFLHYGIRNEDMQLIKALCEKHEVDFNWVSEDILRNYHAKKVDSIEITDNETEAVIKSAIQQIR